MSTMSTTSVAPEIRKRVFASRDRFWRPEDFDGSPDAVAQTLSRMTRPEISAESGEGSTGAAHPPDSAWLPRHWIASLVRSSVAQAPVLVDGAPPWRSAFQPK